MRNHAQDIASDPFVSAWVSASAGTGKTYLLVRRLLRMFLAGAEPSKILCLTYTNAGAAEMIERVFSRAREWAVMSDSALRDELLSVVGEHDEGLAAKARALFSQLVDSPVPLKIYTIHAFCQSVLKRFPLEAGVSPHFKIAEEAEANTLLAEAYSKLARDMQNPASPEDAQLAPSFAKITSAMSESSFEEVRREIIGGREKFAALMSEHKDYRRFEEALFARIFTGFGDVVEDFVRDVELYKRRECAGLDEDALRKYIRAAEESSSSTMKKNAQNLAEFLGFEGEAARAEAFEKYLGAFLTASGKVREKLFTKEARAANGALVPLVEAAAEKARKTKEFLELSDTFNTTAATSRIAFALGARYMEAKEKAGIMDFSDLIEATKTLFAKPGISEWILYKLDGGIDHILIDEAQDTSGLQWSIAATIAENFFTVGRRAGEGKSIFCVGDRKQSIFSFQGADIGLFDEYKELFKTRVQAGKYEWREVPLSTSFRSARNILTVVDDVIANEEKTSGVIKKGEEIRHVAAREDMAGYVELVPLVKMQAVETEDTLKPPVEEVIVRNRLVDLSAIAAAKCAEILERGYAPQDIMILVQKRSSAKYLAQKFKEAGVPIAGEDRIILAEHIIVQDIISLFNAICFPDDDLAVCEVLKSPFFNLGDEDLFELCHGRGEESVYARLMRSSRYSGAASEIAEFARCGRVMSPLAFLNYVLKTKGKERNFAARFGADGRRILGAALDAAEAYDIAKIGKSPIEFVRWLRESGIEAKRGKAAGSGEVKISTVHSSKGLEAPIVILLDANANDTPLKEKLVWNGGLPFYRSSGFADVNEDFAGIIEAEKRAGLDEFYRLMYVALTRARDELYILGAEDRGRENEKSWYSCIRAALEANPVAVRRCDPILQAFGAEIVEPEILCLGEKNRKESKSKNEETIEEEFMLEQPGSRLRGNDKEGRENDTPIFERGKSPLAAADEARERGVVLHKALEHNDSEAVRELAAVPELAFIFSNPARVEAEIIGAEGEMRIDRLVFTSDAVWIIDYKSDSAPPARMPEKYRVQLLKYLAAVRQIYPGRTVRAAILWLAGKRLEELQSNL